MEPITTIEVVLSRIITEDGDMAVRISLPSTYNAVELLGLLEAAKSVIFNEIRLHGE
jgi:hypothetical protein